MKKENYKIYSASYYYTQIPELYENDSNEHNTFYTYHDLVTKLALKYYNNSEKKLSLIVDLLENENNYHNFIDYLVKIRLLKFFNEYNENTIETVYDVENTELYKAYKNYINCDYLTIYTYYFDILYKIDNNIKRVARLLSIKSLI